MKHYEIAIVLHPDLEIDLDNPLKKIEGIITGAGGSIDKQDNWGKRKLAYRINGQDWGVFVFYQVQLEPSSVAAVEANLRIADEVMRHLIVSLENQRRVTKPTKKSDQSTSGQSASKASSDAADQSTADTTQGDKD